MEINKKSLEMIEALANAKAPSGFEDETVAVARAYTQDNFDVEEDKLRNFYIKRRKNSGDKPLLMLDAHSDEVGFMVHSIRPNGLIRVLDLGRWTNSTLPASKVKVKTSTGEWISGIFVNIPAHFRKGTGSNGEPAISELSVDVGARSLEEARDVFHIRMGDPIVPATRFEFDEKNHLMFGKAFDCRIGCAALIETMNRIKDLDLNVDVIGVLSSQEEVGERGCKVSVNHVKPDIALCYEGCPADDTFTEPYAIQTALKKGPMFRHMDCSAICSPRLQRFVLDLAHEKGLPVQESVREGGGNNAAVINTALNGIPVVTAGVPVRYIHAMNCMTSYEDFEYTVNLMVEIIKHLSADVINKF